ncbi:MAG: curli-like amyloid fiber formation chaperone CsgH [Aeromonas sp.]
MPISLSLNMAQGEQGVSLTPTLISERAMTITFTLMVHSQGASGRSSQQQSNGMTLLAGQVREAGNIRLGLRCPYRVEVTAQVWQHGQLLVEQKELIDCPT